MNKDSAIDEFYRDHYRDIMGTGFISKLWAKIHMQMEKPFSKKYFSRILEVGAGNGEHLSFVQCQFGEYVATDIRIENLKNIPSKFKNVKVTVQNVESLDFEDGSFNRIIVTCLLVHLEKPELAVSELKRVVSKSEGFVTIYLPCEPGIFLRAARSFTTHLKARSLGVQNIRELHYLEHRNYYLAVDSLIRSEFDEYSIKAKYYPFGFLSWNFNLYKIYQIKLIKD